jgi:hypothetical protein
MLVVHSGCLMVDVPGARWPCERQFFAAPA